MITRSKAQLDLALLWVLSALGLAVILFVQTQLGEMYSQEQAARLWEWLGQWTLPTVTLMLGVAGAAAASRNGEAVHLKLYRMAQAASVVYLLALAAILGLIALRYSLRPLELGEHPLQFFYAVAHILIGIFFVRGEPESE